MTLKLLHFCGQEILSEDDELRGENKYRVDGAEVDTCPNCKTRLKNTDLHPAPEIPADLQKFHSPFDADEFNEAHRCSACWGLLVKERTAPRTWVCWCEECREKTQGYVSARYVEKRFEKNREEASAAKSALRDAVPWMRSKQTAAEILAEIGF